MTRLAAAFLATLATAAIAPAAAQTTLRFGQIPSTVRSVSTLSMFVAERNGLFAREGIAVEKVLIAGGTDKMVAALERGEVDITQTATPYLIEAVLRGSDAVGVASETANPIYSLIVKPEIARYADLKGKLVGLSRPIDTICPVFAWAGVVTPNDIVRDDPTPLCQSSSSNEISAIKSPVRGLRDTYLFAPAAPPVAPRVTPPASHRAMP